MSHSFAVSKNLAVAASTTAIGTVSTAVPNVITLNTSVLGGQRRLVIWSSAADLSTQTVTVYGSNDAGTKISEVILPSTSTAGGVATTYSDFNQVTAIEISSVANVRINIGTAAQGGTPWYRLNQGPSPTNISFGITYSSTRVGMTGAIEYTLADPSDVTATPTASYGKPYPWTLGISTAGGNATSSGVIGFPIAGWRLTINSTNTAGTIYAITAQSGLGS